MRAVQKEQQGFSLIELMISMAVGLIVLGGAVSMYNNGVNATWTVSQRAEMQQDSRAAYDLLTQDISLAGSGLPPGGLAIATGGVIPSYGCDVITNTCHLGAGNNAAVNFPQTPAPVVNQMYWLIPGFQQGPTVAAAIGRTDAITTVYSDSVLLLQDYYVQFNDNFGNSVNFIYPAPVPTPVPQQLSATGTALQVGDLILFQYGSNYAIAAVTAAPGATSTSPYNVSFANNDLMRINQNAATSSNLASVIGACKAVGVCVVGAPPVPPNLNAVTATRIWMITYYIDNTGTAPKLMRQVNARQPVPVADNVENLQFTYDTYDSSGNLLANTGNAGGTGNYNLIRTINLIHLSLRSQSRNGRGYQGYDMQSSISARNLSFSERY